MLGTHLAHAGVSVYGLVWVSEASGAAAAVSRVILFVYVVEGIIGELFQIETLEAEGVDHFSLVVVNVKECVSSGVPDWPIAV